MNTYRRVVKIVLLLLAVTTVSCMPAQTAGNSALVDDFAAVTIKPNKYEAHGGGGVTAFGYRATGITISRVILYAYSKYRTNEWRDELLRGPSWVTSVRYDVTAKLDSASEAEWQHLNSGARRERIRPLLRKMLAERFGLVLHSVEQEASVYGLFVATHSPKLKPSNPNVKFEDGRHPLDMYSLGWGSGTVVAIHDSGPSAMSFYATPMSSLVLFMSTMSPRLVVDKTGLTGTFDFDLPKRPVEPTVAGAPDIPDEVFDVRSLGLRLKPIRSPVETWVIDHIDKPTEP